MLKKTDLTTCYATFNRAVALLESDHVVEVIDDTGRVVATLHPRPVTTYGTDLPKARERFAVVDRIGTGRVSHHERPSGAIHAAAVL